MTAAGGAPESGSTLLVGTEKGLFRLHPGHGPGAWRIDGPHLAGYRILHTAVMPGQPRELLAALLHGA